MRPDQKENSCWKIHSRDKTITPQWETFKAIQKTIIAQVNYQVEKSQNSAVRNMTAFGAAEEKLIRSNFDYSI
jgi:hypothetical protein